MYRRSLDMTRVPDAQPPDDLTLAERAAPFPVLCALQRPSLSNPLIRC